MELSTERVEQKWPKSLKRKAKKAAKIKNISLAEFTKQAVKEAIKKEV